MPMPNQTVVSKFDAYIAWFPRQGLLSPERAMGGLPGFPTDPRFQPVLLINSFLQRRKTK